MAMALSNAKCANEPHIIPEEKPSVTDANVASLDNTDKQPHDTSEAHGGDVDLVSQSKLVWKLDLNMMPLLFCLYMLSYLDRSNIGNAKIAGLNKDLKFSKDGNDYTWLLTTFYISYIIFEWFALMWKIVPAHIWASFCVLGWGVIATLQSSTTSWSGMMALRFFLGMFEAGFGPGLPFYLSYFYLRNEVGLRIGIITAAGPLSTCFAGALAYGITSGHSSFANWRLLFLVEGLPTILIAGVVWFFFPDSPEKARFLNKDDKATARARGVKQVGYESYRVGRIVWSDIGAALLDTKNYITAMMYFSCNVSFSSLPVFLPTIINEMGFTTINAQGLSAPPYFISFIVVLATTHVADRTGQRGVTICILSLVGAIGYILLATTFSVSTRYLGVYFATIGIYPAIINILPWVVNNQGSDTKRGAGIAILNLIGQCGPLLGTRIYPATDGPRYKLGMWTCAGFLLFNGFLAIALRTLLVWENKMLDEKYGLVGEQDANGIGSEVDGPNFRYVL
ncbi:MFS transporter-like protein [Tricladium varicosporioides]|nr:MFS transporter-like protein [Hymenoscyphus varicosporioides]